jgi:hypothetical protein
MRTLTIVAVTALALSHTATAQPIVFTRIADTTTAIPNGSGNFTGWLSPSVFGSTIAFTGSGGGNQEGVYTRSIGGGPLSRVADTNTPVPGGTGTFSFIDDSSVSGSTLEFRAGASSPPVGIYTVPTGGGPLSVVANTNTAIPGGTGNFSGMSNTSLSGTTVAFSGGGSSGQRGVYTSSAGGPLTRIADTNTPIPSGTGTFANAGLPGVSVFGSTVAFYGSGSGGQQGIYTASTGGGSLARIADTNTPFPGGTGNFTSIEYPALSGSAVAIIGVGVSQQGIFAGSTTGGPLARVADTNTPIPNGIGKFSTLFFNGSPSVSASGSEVVFKGAGGNGQVGIYLGSTDGTALAKLIMAGDALDGRIVSSLSFGPAGLDGSSLAFEAGFTDGTSGEYVGVFSVPEPSSLALAGFGAAFVCRHVRRRSKRMN